MHLQNPLFMSLVLLMPVRQLSKLSLSNFSKLCAPILAGFLIVGFVAPDLESSWLANKGFVWRITLPWIFTLLPRNIKYNLGFELKKHSFCSISKHYFSLLLCLFIHANIIGIFFYKMFKEWSVLSSCYVITICLSITAVECIKSSVYRVRN